MGKHRSGTRQVITPGSLCFCLGLSGCTRLRSHHGQLWRPFEILWNWQRNTDQGRSLVRIQVALDPWASGDVTDAPEHFCAAIASFRNESLRALAMNLPALATSAAF